MKKSGLEVVILNDFAALNGGSTAVALASARGLAARGVAVTLFTSIGPAFAAQKDQPNLQVICLEQDDIAKNPNRLQAATQGLRNRPAEAKLRELLKGKSPRTTVVHAHTWTKSLSPYALAVAADLGFPLVVTLHDFFIACPSGGLFEHRTGQLCTRRPLSVSCVTCNCDRRNYAHKLWRVGRTLIQNKLLGLPAKVACFVGVSDHSLALLRPMLPAQARLQKVRNPVDCQPGEPAAVGANREFLFIGRFEREKGILLFAEAMGRLGLPATFIGDGALRAEAKALCPHGTFTGWLSPAQIRERLATARALVFPPLWYETLGLVVIEAAAAGVPAIVSGKCAATETVADGQTGLYFEHGSCDALCRTVARMANDDAMAARLGANAHEWYWKDPWSSERHVEDLVSVYESLTVGTGLTVPEPIPA